MKRLQTMFSLLLSDERSAVRQKTAVLLSLGVVGVVLAGLLLMSLSEQTYRDLDRRVLRASQEPADGPLV